VCGISFEQEQIYLLACQVKFTVPIVDFIFFFHNEVSFRIRYNQILLRIGLIFKYEEQK